MDELKSVLVEYQNSINNRDYALYVSLHTPQYLDWVLQVNNAACISHDEIQRDMAKYLYVPKKELLYGYFSSPVMYCASNKDTAGILLGYTACDSGYTYVRFKQINNSWKIDFWVSTSTNDIYEKCKKLQCLDFSDEIEDEDKKEQSRLTEPIK